jgi:preprotein translocase subunit SecB
MAEQQAPQQQFTIQRIYLKDVSFETPMGPEVFKQKWEPKIQLDMNTKTASLGDENFEVVLKLTVTANVSDEKVGFLAEIQQAGIFSCVGFSNEQLQNIHSVSCAEILFPYARETLDNLVVKGSFPALMLAPINFEALYKHALAQAQSAQADKTH